jgi:hypothetical protein
MTSLLEKYGTPIEQPKEESPYSFTDIEIEKQPSSLLEKYSQIPEKSTSKKVLEKIKEFPGEVNTLVKDIGKGIISGATLGGSEYLDVLKPKEGPSKYIGQAIGIAAPFALTYTGIALPALALGRLAGFGKIGLGAIKTAAAATTGAGLEAGREVIAGEELQPGRIATEGALVGVLDLLFKGSKTAYSWFKGLKPTQQAQLLVDGTIPKDLTLNQYKFWESEAFPKIQEIAQNEYEEALQKAIQSNDESYAKELRNVQAKHEQKLHEMTLDERTARNEFEALKESYQNELKQVAAQHEANNFEIQKANDEASNLFEQQQKQFEQMKARQRVVENALIPKEGGEPLQGRVSTLGGNMGPIPTATGPVAQTIENRIGNIISPDSIAITAPNGRGNTTTAGEQLIAAVRANDAVDYQAVNEAYNLSRQLNARVELPVPNLVNSLRETQRQLLTIPKRSPPQDQLLNIVESILERTAVVGEEGSIIGYNPINNNLLEEQAKAIRHFMDFNFEHGNTRGIFTPTINQIEDAIQMSANMVGDYAAAEANQNARAAYRQWALDYDNPYIRPIRDTRNFDYSKTFKSALDFDEFNMINNILERSNAGQQLSGIVRREAVEKHLAPFMENPRKVNPKEFNKTLRELRSIITPEEEQAIRIAFNEARRTPVIRAKKLPKFEIPEKKLKEFPTQQKIPIFEKKPKQVAEITDVKIPIKGLVKTTPEMQAAAKKLKKTPEDLMRSADTPSGLKNLKSDLSGSDTGKKLFDKIGKQKVREILFQGKVEHKFTGKELYETINKGENYALLVEILGEDAAADLLVTAKQIGEKRATVDAFKKFGSKVATIKTALLFGIL